MISQPILPMYLAIDTSVSMAPRFPQVDAVLSGLVDELSVNPVLGDRVRVAILTFSTAAELQLPLTDLTEVRALPRLRAAGAAAYGPVFRELARTIARDEQLLRHRDAVLYRPIVFFITGSNPVDRDWEPTRQALLDRVAPRIIAVGGGEVSAEILERVKTLKAFKITERDWGQPVLSLLIDYLGGTTRSIVIKNDGTVTYPGVSYLDGEVDHRDLW